MSAASVVVAAIVLAMAAFAAWLGLRKRAHCACGCCGKCRHSSSCH